MTRLPEDVHAQCVFRSHEADGCVSRVWYSPCDAYRYGLSRQWSSNKAPVLFIMLNPSTADEHRNDPTVARCELRARKMGYGGVMIANIFAFRATKPTDLKKAIEPVGALNGTVLRAWVASAGLSIAAWGAHGAHLGRAAEVAATLPKETCHLGLTKRGHPRHPLYVSFETRPTTWTLKDRQALM